jgi:hypothetical protein
MMGVLLAFHPYYRDSNDPVNKLIIIQDAAGYTTAAGAV